MFNNGLFILTTLGYLALSIFVLQPIKATGDRLVGWGIIAFVLIILYSVCSLLLTISVASRGGFSWISTSAVTRNIGITLLWLGLTASVIIPLIARTEFPRGHLSSGMPAILSYPFYFGTLWLPLLMLVPYAILLQPGWRETCSAVMYKIPLIAGSLIGLLLLTAPWFISTTGILKNYRTQEDINTALKNIEYETSLTTLLSQTGKDEHIQIRTAAINKIKQRKNCDTGLIHILNEENPWFFNWVYQYISDNETGNMEKFIEPVNNSIPMLASTLNYEVLKNPWKGEGTYHLLNAEPLFDLLDKHFKNHKQVFHANILALQQTVNTQPQKRDGDEARFKKALHLYRNRIQQWLEMP